jgi:tRNA (uracil-5-)-methyltransferase
MEDELRMNATMQEYSERNCQLALEQKLERVCSDLQTLALPLPTLHPSPWIHYRQRAEFRVWHEADDTYFAMFDPAEPHVPLRVDQFPAASQRINRMMSDLRGAVLRNPVLRQRLFQVEFLSTLSGEALAVLVYHRRLDAAWQHEAEVLPALLDATIIGRSRGQRLVLGDDFVTEKLEVDGKQLVLRQPEGCFTQPNADVNRAMLGWARSACEGSTGGLLELYCGIGNFTVALADRFKAVLATEISKVAIAAAHHNLAANAIDNTFVARLSSAEAAQALSRERPFRRLAAFDIGNLDARSVLVDPPRAGLDDRTVELVRGFERIVYISCNPHTLEQNLRSLRDTHEVEKFALFDQFPYTPHMECGVLLQRVGRTTRRPA